MAAPKSKRGAQPESGVRRAALYLRVSKSAQEEDGTSLETQEQRCREHARARGYVVDQAHVYREVHTGVELWERPQLSALRAVVRERQVDAVVVYAIDRLSRDPVHLGVILSEADHAHVDVLFVTEPLDNTPEGQLIRFVRGYAAKVEHEKIRERSMRGRHARLLAGRLLPVGRPLYGYTYNRERGAYAINPAEAPTVRRMFELALQGTPLRRICAAIIEGGYPAPNNGPRWFTSVIQHMLRNVRYTGKAVAWQTKTVRHPETGRRMNVPRPPEEQVILPDGTIPPLVDEETFAAVQARLTLNKQRAARNNKNPEKSLLRGGYIRCGYCNGAIATYTVRNSETRDGFRYDYKCVRRGDPGHPHPECCRFTMSCAPLDQIVWGHVSRILKHPDLIAAELERMRGSDPTTADLAAVEQSLTSVARQQRNLIENLANVTGAAAALIADKLNTLEAQRAQLQAEREQVLARAEAHRRAQERMGDVAAWCRTVAANLETLTYAEKRLALDALGVRVRLWRKGHEPRYEITANVPLEAAPAASIVSSGP
jgi:site-specific DNA recombinase